MRQRPVLRILGVLFIATQLISCAGTEDRLKKQGIEVHSGKVMRVYHF